MRHNQYITSTYVYYIFRKHFKDGVEKGSAFAIYHKGELVVDLWGGYGNELAQWPWQRDTVTKLFSATKAIGGIVMAMLVDR